MKEKLKKLNEYEWILPKDSKPGMNVDGKIIGNKRIIDTMDEGAVEQLANVAMMPGIVNPVLAMPDAHFGYGMPMGAVAAFDAENGVISSGLCGFDINCGINSIRTNLTASGIKPKLKELVSALFNAVPVGVGSKGKLRLNPGELDEVLTKGVNWAVENGYGVKDDIQRIEENGCMKGADPNKVSDLAKKRGGPQLGTLGAGNHFLEIQTVNEIYDEKLAKKWGIVNKDQVMIMLHCLPEDAKILTEHGCTLKISDLENKKNLSVKCMNFKNHGLEDTSIIKFFKLKLHSGLFEIVTKTGKKLAATGDHPILTPHGLKFMKEIKEGDRVAVLSYEGVEYEEPSDEIIVDENDIRRIGGSKRTINRLKNKNLLPLRLNSEFLPVLTKLLGFLTGDGWLGKNRDRWTAKFIGEPEDLEKIRMDISKLGYKATRVYKLKRKSEVTYTDGEERIIDGTSYQIVVGSLGLPLIFYALGAPFGNKSKVKFNVPDWIFRAPLWIKRLYLAGFFGAELTKPSNPKKERYRFSNPLLSINKSEKLKSNGYRFLNQITKLAEEFGVKAVKILELKGVITKTGEKTVKLRLKLSSEKNNLIKLWSKIGYEYCQYRENLSAHALQYLNFEQNSLKKESVLTGKPESKLLVTSHSFRENDITAFPDFVSSFALNPPTPLMWDTIESKKEIKDYNGAVYDFTVLHKDHNFIANGFVTGNCGSRGFGHQVASDYLRIQEKAVQKYNIKLPDRQLACAPVNSPEGQDYFRAMKCAVNYSFANRLVMTQWVRETFEKVFGKDWKAMDMHTVWGLAHNVVKLEEFNGRKLYVHRKGATRNLPNIPALIAGSMGTPSFIVTGTEKAVKETFASTCHGAGRAMSRNEAIRRFRGEKIVQALEKQGEVIKGASMKGIAEEAPEAYKNVNDVVDSVHEAGISLKVVRVNPLAVLKG